MKIVVIIPTLNEESEIEAVVREFRQALPTASVVVYDNGSSDSTIKKAQSAGARVQHVNRRGKGNVITQAFAEQDGDVFLMVDGDGTYDSTVAGEMIRQVTENSIDMVVAERQMVAESAKPRRGHGFGNATITRLTKLLFQTECRDVLSGYRAMSRSFVKSYPGTASGFEIEVQLTAHAAILRATETTISAPYCERSPMASSRSKLRTVPDGIRIGVSLLRSYRHYAPARFFGTASLVACLFASAAIFNFDDVESRSSGSQILLISVLLYVGGAILTAITRLQRQQLRLSYLAMKQSGVSERATK